MIFSARGTETGFENLRGLGWYDAMAELGAVLFVSGWCAGSLPSPPPAAIEPPARRELLVVVLFAAVMLALQAPRVERVIFEYHGHRRPSRWIHRGRSLALRSPTSPCGPATSGKPWPRSTASSRPRTARDRPGSDPSRGGTDPHPGDATATPRHRPREVTRPSRAVRRITMRQGTTGDEPISLHDRTSRLGRGVGGDHLRRLSRQPDAGPGTFRRRRARARRSSSSARTSRTCSTPC